MLHHYLFSHLFQSCIQYNLFTQTVKSASDAKFDDFWKAMSSLSKTITSAGIENTGRFPFVRVPMFEIHASHTRNFCGVAVVVWSPLVLESQRQRWSAFVMEQQGWYDESKYLLEFTSPDENLPSFDLTSTTPSFIWWGSLDLDEGIIETAPPGGPFAPAWQCSPPPSSRALLNYDIMSNKQVLTCKTRYNSFDTDWLVQWTRAYIMASTVIDTWKVALHVIPITPIQLMFNQFLKALTRAARWLVFYLQQYHGTFC